MDPEDSAKGAVGYSLRQDPVPNTQIDFGELVYQREISEQRRLASLWNKESKEVAFETQQLQTLLYTNWEHLSARKIVDRLAIIWKSFETVHSKYLPGIRDSKRLQEVQQRFKSLKEQMMFTIEECETQIRTDQETQKRDDERSIKSHKSHQSQSSTTSRSSSSSRKERFRAMLLAKKKLELAKSRAQEEAELAKSKAQQEAELVKAEHERSAKKELRLLEDEAVLAELDWKIENEFDEETGVVNGVDNIVQTTYPIEEKPLGQSPQIQLDDSEPRTPKIPAPTPKPSLPLIPVSCSTPQDTAPGSCKEKPATEVKSNIADTANKGALPVTECQQPPYQAPRTFQYRPKSQPEDKVIEQAPKDHVAAMWKVQLLNGISPTPFNGNPADFPFFKEQAHTHLESELLTDAQRVEYLPKFLKGEALEVIKRNRGSSYSELMKILEERFGRPIQVTQACIEELVSGPKLAYGDNMGLLNFAEKLNTSTKVLKGDVEREASVATNLRRIVNRLPNDLITKWQTENYEIVSRGGTARLKDIAKFVKRQASIRNDPVFGMQPQRGENRTNKFPPKASKGSDLPTKNATINATSLKNAPKKENSANCAICKSTPHRLQECPIVKQCDRVAVRRQYAASYGFCFNCGCHNPDHSGTSCPEPPACSLCPGHHLPILHRDNNNGRRTPGNKNTHNPTNRYSTPTADPITRQPQMEQGTRQPPSDRPQTSITSAGVSTTRAQVLLNVVPVTITAENGGSLSTYAFLDNGCTDTLIDKELADHLDLKGISEQIGIKTITNSEELVESRRVSFTLSPVEAYGEDIDVNEAYVLPDLNQSERVLPGTVDVHKYPHLQDLTFPVVDFERVSIIVGSNVPVAHLQKEVRIPKDNKSGLYGYRYPLGWSISGPLTIAGTRRAELNFISVGHKPDDFVERFWKIEDYGTLKAGEKPLSVEDKRALKIIEETTTLVDGHYEVGLLWKEDQPKLPNNRILAERRAELLRRRLTKAGNEQMAAKYRGVMTEYISKGYARKLSPEEAARESSITWYLPHHPVTNPNKPDKLRIVFDAASEYEGTSLNKNLVQGPDMTNSLVGVLLRFRQGHVGVAADVEAMFHQVRVRKQDQEALRFLWWTDDYDKPPDVYVMEVHIFGATSSPCVANWALRRTASDNAERFNPQVVATVDRNFYVDDALPSFSEENAASTVASDLVKILNHGGFNLTKFMTNSKNVLATIPTEKRASPDLNLDLDELPVERALGIRWFAETDELGFDIKNLNRPETKRGVLSAVCSLYDPLGFAAPVALTARVIIQDMWKAKVDWDQPLEENFLARWKSWTSQLSSLSALRIPRCYLPAGTDASKCKLQLHIFSDASEIGYGASAYLRVENPDGSIHCSFVVGKARNAPVKFTSIPRLELQAAVLSTRLNKMLREELDLPIQSTKFWTDSEIVLHYLKNERRRFQTYVANRVEEIRGNSQPDDWNHVPGVLNPADDASRGLNPSELNLDHRWLRGPEFLWQPESFWPNASLREVPDEGLELKKETHANCTDINTNVKTRQASVQSNCPPATPVETTMQQIISTSSDWNRLRRQVAWLTRFTHFIRDRKTVHTGHLTLEDYDAATLSIAKIVQHAAYDQEIKDLKTRGEVRGSSKIASLNPMQDDHGVLRVKGRIASPPAADTARNQIILPRDHPATVLMVRHTHASIGHLGREHLIARVRETFWIPQIRVLTRSVLGRCLVCKKLNAKPMTQQMAPLPRSRMMAYEPPFSYTGMDLFGPLYVKHGRGTAKRWCCLFTCLTTRSVHLELVHSMDTNDFIMCLRRFMNRRGEVTELRCDRGSNFVGGERELRESIEQWNQQQIVQELLQRGCKWVFQPPTASSMSGIWERMVRSAKTVLKSILGAQVVTEAVLQTLLTEVERVLNGRALTANSDDPNDLQPLTPAHFLMQRKTICLPPGIFEKADQYHRRKWRQVQFLADLFWKRWLREYLPTLQARGKWRKVLPNLKPKALVLLVDDNVPRGCWKLGRVLEVFPGPDGLVRTAKVKTKDSVFIRPIQKLCLLENDLENN